MKRYKLGDKVKYKGKDYRVWAICTWREDDKIMCQYLLKQGNEKKITYVMDYQMSAN